MKNSNVKIFTAFIYSLFLALIIGSVIFLVVQRIQLAKQAETYASQIVERINNSYIANSSFTTPAFIKDVKDAMQGFSDLIKVITIVDSQNIIHNRFRFDSINPDKDPNFNWQNELRYKYNPLLYEEQNYPLYLPGQVNAQINVLYQRLPTQLIKNVLQFDTIVILALLILSFLAFLIIPKRDPAETAWALQSIAEEDDMYREAENDSWQSQELPESTWEKENTQTAVSDNEDQILGFSKLENNVVEANSEVLDHLTHEEVDLSFNDHVADGFNDHEENIKEINSSEEPIDLLDSPYASQTSSLTVQEKNSDDILETNDSQVKHDEVTLDRESSSFTTSSPFDLSSEFSNQEELELVDYLDEGLGDDEPIELDADIFSQLAMSEEAVPSALTESRRQEILTWLDNFLKEQRANSNILEFAVALLETDGPPDVETVRALLEQYLALKASILTNDKGMAIFFPCKNIQDGIEELQSAASKLPAIYLKSLKMGITGISPARSDMDPATVLSEMEYALAHCDEVNNISIFDANDQVFNQQRNKT